MHPTSSSSAPAHTPRAADVSAAMLWWMLSLAWLRGSYP
jgi:hypothetical protein